MFTGQLVHFPGVAAASRPHAAQGGCLQQVRGSYLAMTCGRIAAEVMFDANSGRGGRPRSRGRVQGRPVGHHCVESAAPSRAPAAQVCPK